MAGSFITDNFNKVASRQGKIRIPNSHGPHMSNDSRLFDLSGKTALVTGGSRGLGLQLAEALGSYGARLLLTARKTNELQQAQVHLQERGIDAQWFPADGSNEADITMLADAAMERLGHVDILVNNAGASWGAPAEDYPIHAWDKVFNLNIRGLFLLTQQIGKRSMIPRKYGRIPTSLRWQACAAIHPMPCSPSPTTPAKAHWSISPAPWQRNGAAMASR